MVKFALKLLIHKKNYRWCDVYDINCHFIRR